MVSGYERYSVNSTAFSEGCAFLTLKKREIANLPFNFKGGDSLHPSHPLPKSFFQIQGSTTQRRTERVKLKSPRREAGTRRGTAGVGSDLNWLKSARHNLFVPNTLTVYRVFVASSGGLVPERQAFRDAINAYNEMDAVSRGVMSFP
jgi:hypothetical protein